MSRLIIIEGPNCVGKTTLANFMVNNSEIDMYCNVKCHKNWDSPQDGFVEHNIVSAMWKYPGLNLVMDRGFLSFVYYHDEYDSIGRFSDWIDELGNWESAKIICLMANKELLKVNANNKRVEESLDEVEVIDEEEIEWYSKVYELIPEHLRIYREVVYYESDWKEEILKKVLSG